MNSSWNPVWGETWTDFLKRKALTEDISNIQESAIESINESSRQAAEEMGKKISALGDILSNNLDNGFNAIVSEIQNTNYILGDISLVLSSGFSQLLPQLGRMNDSLDTLIKIAKTPAQVAAYEQFEIARDAFRQCLYQECIEALNKSINGDHSSPGYRLEWRFYHLLAVIRLGFVGCDISLVNPSIAEEMFLLSARYAKADYHKDAARSLLSAGWAAYVQGNLSTALTHTESAYALDKSLCEALFQAAKILISQNDSKGAFLKLKSAVFSDSRFIYRILGEDLFTQKAEDLGKFFSSIFEEKYTQLAPIFNLLVEDIETKANIVPGIRDHKIALKWKYILTKKIGLIDLFLYETSIDEDKRVINKYYDFEINKLEISRELEINKLKNSWKNEGEVVDDKGVSAYILINKLGEKRAIPSRHLKFCKIPIGTFIMGSSPNCGYRNEDEAPHEVVLDKSFEIQANLVTKELWMSIMEKNLSAQTDLLSPVELSWLDAINFCIKISDLLGLDNCYELNDKSVSWNVDAKGFRLPTEAEWEYTCRAGSREPVFWLKTESNGKPIFSKKPNRWGIHDMPGKNLQWTWDVYGRYPTERTINPIGPNSNENVNRVARGSTKTCDSYNIHNLILFMPSTRTANSSMAGLKLAKFL